MRTNTGFFTKTLAQTLIAIECMASPKGTTIKELSKCLSLTRRSVFRLIRTIEDDLHIPVIAERKSFGGVATYRLPAELAEKFSHTATPPLILSLRQAILFYLILNDEVFQDKPKN
jgi:transcriptional antiterminator